MPGHRRSNAGQKIFLPVPLPPCPGQCEALSARYPCCTPRPLPARPFFPWSCLVDLAPYRLVASCSVKPPSASKQNAALPSAQTLPALSSRENRPPTFSARLPAAPSALFCSRQQCSHSFAMRGECCAEHHWTFVSAGGPPERSFKSTCCLQYLWW